MFDDFAILSFSLRSEKVKNSQEEMESRRMKQLIAARKVEKWFFVLYLFFIFFFFSFMVYHVAALLAPVVSVRHFVPTQPPGGGLIVKKPESHTLNSCRTWRRRY